MTNADYRDEILTNIANRRSANNEQQHRRCRQEQPGDTSGSADSIEADGTSYDTVTSNGRACILTAVCSHKRGSLDCKQLVPIISSLKKGSYTDPNNPAMRFE